MKFFKNQNSKIADEVAILSEKSKLAAITEIC